MTQDGFSWWKQRFSQMSEYFDAFRIDHILGFFRIWSIPIESVEGIMGHFVPALPVDPMEFAERRIPADPERYLEPYITEDVLEKVFGRDLLPYARQFINPAQQEETPQSPGSPASPSPTPVEPGGVGWAPLTARAPLSVPPRRFNLRPEFRTQRQIENWFSRNAGLKRSLAEKIDGPLVDARPPACEESAHSLPEDPVARERLKEGLFDLASNVILFEVPPSPCHPNLPSTFHFRLGMENTLSFQALDPVVLGELRELYIDYFFRRQDEFWRREALTKLPALKRVSNMLICGEDLGMVPATVPEVMRQLGLLSLEVQRMPKQLHRLFSHPPQAPYLSVVTPSTHDMSTIRGWWEEDHALIQKFWTEELSQAGHAPATCTAHANRLVVEQHLRSPAMWAVFQLQDLLGMDAELRRPDPHEERINVPAVSCHYWQYRMHLDLETLLVADGFNQDLAELLRATGRA
jgi:4-alpha-glucanotransferase